MHSDAMAMFVNGSTAVAVWESLWGSTPMITSWSLSVGPMRKTTVGMPTSSTRI
jgi:hypothetical protein